MEKEELESARPHQIVIPSIVYLKLSKFELNIPQITSNKTQAASTVTLLCKPHNTERHLLRRRRNLGLAEACQIFRVDKAEELLNENLTANDACQTSYRRRFDGHFHSWAPCASTDHQHKQDTADLDTANALVENGIADAVTNANGPCQTSKDKLENHHRVERSNSAKTPLSQPSRSLTNANG
uniref:Uncharacterized protein n=1 Tax=Cacopsylla melanoneura TaxID=428564 RepID=A0A8D8VHZ4_9HEMI